MAPPPLRPHLLFLSLTALPFLPPAQTAQNSAEPSAEISSISPQRRFEYKFSLKGPHLVQADGTVPFWLHTGNAIPSSDQIRVTTSLKSQKGSVWTKFPAEFEFWEVEATFRVSGRGRVGADGLALWFTAEPGPEGPVFGAGDRWNGVGIFFDSFDNDGKKNNPAVLVVPNDGSHSYDHQNDGSGQAVAWCSRDFRNKPYPVRARVRYYRHQLTVFINGGFTPDPEDFEFCCRAENLVLPARGHFGVSAATGGLADDHDLLSFLTFRLSEPSNDTAPPGAAIPEREKEKYQEELEQFQQELQRRKEQFQREHPELQGEAAQEAEAPEQQELRQVLQGQQRLHSEAQQLRERLAGAWEEARGYLREMAQRAAEQPRGELTGHEVEKIVKNQEELLGEVKELRTSLPGSADPARALGELRELLHGLRQDLEQLSRRPAPSCPEPPPFPSCLAPLHFGLFLALQTFLFLAYFLYRNQQEAAAKKFF